MEASSSSSTSLMVAPAHMAPPHPPSPVTASAAPIVVPRLPEQLTDSAASSPAITTSAANGLAPPSVSPMAPSLLHMPNGSEATNAVAMMPQAMKAKAVTTKSQAGMNGGRWTEQEHQSFLAGLRLYGREWKKVASKIKTRTSAQIRSHAQKYFAKLARDDETRKLGSGGGANGLPSHMMGPDGAASLYGYMSDDGSSTTAGNLSGDDGADETDSNTSQQQQQQQQHRLSSSSTAAPPLNTPSHRAILPVHPFPSPIMGQPNTGLSINALFHGRGGAPLVVSAAGTNTKKRSRPSGASAHDLSPPHTTTPFKQRKSAAGDAVAPHRLPSPEELVETVSPTVRQRLSSLIEAEISALQVLSCITWLQQQHQQGDLKVQLQAPPSSSSSGASRHGSVVSSSSSSSASSTSGAVGFPASSLAMFAAERSPSIF